MDTREKILSVVENAIPLELDEVPGDATFTELGIASVDALNVMVDLEEAFEIDLSDVAMEEASTLNKLVLAVDKLKEESGGEA